MGLEHQRTNAANIAVALVTTYGLRVIGAIIIRLPVDQVPDSCTR